MVQLWLRIMKNEQTKRKQLNPNYQTKVCHKMTQSVQMQEFKSADFFSVYMPIVIKMQLLFIGLFRVYKLTLLIGCVKEDFSFQKQM